ncbi:leukocyte cysteine proteinase inhibitor 1-like [Rhinophrynus dorsalis]
MEQHIVGGLGTTHKANSEVQAICDKMKPDVEKQCGKKFGTFEATEYRCQTVAGTNYFIKICVGGDNYVHVCVYESLPHDGNKLNLKGCQHGKTKHDKIEFF